MLLNNSMPQNLSLPGTSHNPYFQVKVKNKVVTQTKRLMIFGEFLCLQDGVFKETIINRCPDSEDSEQINNHFWETIIRGDIVHTTIPRANTKSKNLHYTEFRADLRQISEQPIDLQQRFTEIINKQKEAMKIDAGKQVSIVVPEENNEEENLQTAENTDLPKQLTVAKTNARIKYIQKMTVKSTYDLCDIRIYSKVLGDLIDACIELNINPYKS